jgi:hypothetical protein
LSGKRLYVSLVLLDLESRAGIGCLQFPVLLESQFRKVEPGRQIIHSGLIGGRVYFEKDFTFSDFYIGFNGN